MTIRLLSTDPRVPTSLRCDWPLVPGDLVQIDALLMRVIDRRFVASDAPEGVGVVTTEVRVEVVI